MNSQIQDSGCKLQVAGFRQRNCNLQSTIRNSKAGFTLIEIIVVVVIISTLLAIVGLEVSGWLSNYKVETEIKTMYVDLMNTRARAMQRNRFHFIVLAATQYTIYEDTNTAPDGNGTLETATDTQVLQKTTSYTISSSLSFGATQFYFDKNGIASNTGSLRLVSTATPDYDCIIIAATRINLGQYSGGNCNAK